MKVAHWHLIVGLGLISMCSYGIACSSQVTASPSTTSGGGQGSDGGNGGGGREDGGGNAGGQGTDGGNGGGGADGASCTQQLYYHDADQDSYGGTDTMMACEPPGPFWVLQGGDCDDANPLVHPAQTTYFPTPYDRGGSPSFDYDCNGQEDRDPSANRANEVSCFGDPLSAPCPTGQGYYVSMMPRSGPGVDLYCGSTRYGYCGPMNNFGQWVCAMSTMTTSTPLGCR